MGSSTGGEDNGEVPPRPACFTPEQWELVVSVKSQIAGLGAVPVWCQSASVFPAGAHGRVLVYANDHGQGMPPWAQAIADEVVRRLSPQQDNSLPHAELTKLSELRDTPEIAETKRKNRLAGLHWSSAIRRYMRAGIERQAAMSAIGAAYHHPAFHIGVLVKLANEARRKRIDAMRQTLIRIWSSEGAQPIDIARKLNVTTQYAGRLLINVRWHQSQEQEASA